MQDVLQARLEDVLKTSCKTSWRQFRKTYCKYVLKTSWKTKSVTLKTSSRRLEDALENKKCLLGCRHWKIYYLWIFKLPYLTYFTLLRTEKFFVMTSLQKADFEITMEISSRKVFSSKRFYFLIWFT